jgi:hypothetical protein
MNSGRALLVLHGSIILLVALACGLPSVIEVSDGTSRMWQAAHSALLLMGVWLIAEAGVLSVLVLKHHELRALTWALITTGYSLAFAAIVQAITGVRAVSPSASLLNMAVFVANLIVVIGSVLTAALMLIGARNAVRAARAQRAAIRYEADSVADSQ